MLFKQEVLAKIAIGDVTVAFRRWVRPTVRAGGTLRTPIGVLAIDDVDAIGEEELTATDAAKAGYVSREALCVELQTKSTGKLYRISFRHVGDDPRVNLRECVSVSADELSSLESQLAKFDATSKQGPWTAQCLRLISEQDGRTAGELAEAIGIEMAVLKRRARQLKELGLTESLQRGYRLSARGRSFLNARCNQAKVS